MLKLKLKLQYFGPLMQRADSLEETLVLAKIEHLEVHGSCTVEAWFGEF